MSDRTRKILKWLRIAWTAFFAAVAVLLWVLWVRSYWRLEQLSTQGPNTALVEPVLESLHGRLWFIWPQYGFGKRWFLSSVSPGEYWGVKSMADVYRPTDVVGFGVGYYTQLGICFPHWFLVMVSVGLAFTPWIQLSELLSVMLTVTPWIRRAKRFSLRTLLIATTLVAVVLGVLVYCARS